MDTIDGKPFAVRYGFDARDDLIEIEYPSGRIVRYGYNDAGELVAVCRAHVVSCTASTPLADTYARGFEYEPSGALRAYTAGNGVQTTVTYDPDRQWVTGITAGSGATRLDLTYAMDPVGNIDGITDATRGHWSQTFTVDAVDRLRTAASGGAYATLAWTYDAHGNRLTGG